MTPLIQRTVIFGLGQARLRGLSGEEEVDMPQNHEKPVIHQLRR